MQVKETAQARSKNKPKKSIIKDLYKKLIEQVSLFIALLKKDKQLLLITGCVLALFVTGVLIIILNSSQPDSDTRALSEITGKIDSSKATDAVLVAEVLPQQRRSDGTMEDDGTWIPINQYFDPFAEPIKLTGVAIGGTGGPMAIIESGGSSFIVKVGDYVDDLWAVIEIKRETAVLRAYNQEISLFLDQPPLTRTLDLNMGDEGQEGS